MSGQVVTAHGITEPVIGSFADTATEDVFEGRSTRRARAALPEALLPIARRRLDQINRVDSLEELGRPPGNRLERLRGDRAGQLGIRIDRQYRICFRWEDGRAYEVQITEYH